MSDVIENRVVELEFDNSRFQDNVDDSIKSLKRLNESLELKGVRDGLDDVNDIVKKMSFAGMEKSLDSVAARFSNLGIIGTTALMNITNKAVDAGTRIAKSLSIDQLSAGWKKYEDMVAAEQTIVSATGKSQEEVNEALEQLLWYTDETSYNFIDMANSIGKFTSNNIDLFDSVDAMQGIASWAAISGQKTQQASMAMYNLSQAMGMGYVSVADWRSIETANMATSAFKNIAIEAGKAVGTLTSGTIENYYLDGKALTVPKSAITSIEEWTDQFNRGKISEAEFEDKLNSISVSAETFRNTLSEKWFDKDVLKATLEEYGKFPTQLYESIQTLGEDNITATEFLGFLKEYKEVDEFGNRVLDISEAAKKTKVSAEALEKELQKLSADEFELSYNAFIAAQEAKTFTDVIDATKDAVSSAWMGIYKTIFGDYEEAKKIWTPIAEEAYELFAEPVNRIGYFISDLKESGSIDALFGGIANIYNSIKNIISGITGGIKKLLGIGDGSKIIDILAKINQGFFNLTEKFKITEDFGKKINTLLEPFSKFADTIFDIIKKIAGAASTIAKDGISALGSGLTNFGVKAMNALDGLIDKLKRNDKLGKNNKKSIDRDYIYPLKKADKVAQTVATSLGTVKYTLKDFSLSSLFDQIKEFGTLVKNRIITNFDKIRNNLTESKISGFFNKINTFAKDSADIIKNIYKNIKETVSLSFNTIWSGIKKFFSDFTNFITNTLIPEIPVIIENVISFITKAINGISDNIDLIRESFSSHREEISGALTNIFSPPKKELKENGAEAVNEVIAGANEAADKAASDTENSGTGKSLLMKALGIAFIGKDMIIDTIFDYNAATFLGGLRSFFEDMGGIGTGIENLLNSLGNVKVTSGAEKVASFIVELGKGVLMLAGAALIFSTIPKEQLTAAIISVTVVAAVVGGLIAGLSAILEKVGPFTKLVATWKKGDGINIDRGSVGLSGMLISFGVAILLISFAIKNMLSSKGVTDKMIWMATLRIIAIMAALTLAMGAITFYVNRIVKSSSDVSEMNGASKVLKNFGSLIIKLGLSMLLMSLAVKILTDSVSKNPESFDRVEKFFLGIMGLLAVVAIFTAWFDSKGKEAKDTNINIELFTNPILSIGLAILLIAAATAWLVSVVGKSEQNAKAFEQVKGFVELLVIILGVIADVKQALKSFGKNTEDSTIMESFEEFGKALIVFGIGLIVVAAGLVAIVAAAALIAGIVAMTDNTLWALLAMGVFVAGLLVACKFIGDKSTEIRSGAGVLMLVGFAMIPIAIGLIAMAAAILAIGVAMSMVQALNISAFGAFAAAISLIIATCLICYALGSVAGYALIGVGILILLGIALAIAGVGVGLGGAALILGAGVMLNGLAAIGEALTWEKAWNIMSAVLLLEAVGGELLSAGLIFSLAVTAWIKPIIALTIISGALMNLMEVMIVAGASGDTVINGFKNFSDGVGQILEKLSQYGKDSKGIIRLARALRIISRNAFALIGIGLAEAGDAIFGEKDDIDDINDDLSETADVISENAEQIDKATASMTESAEAASAASFTFSDAYNLMNKTPVTSPIIKPGVAKQNAKEREHGYDISSLATFGSIGIDKQTKESSAAMGGYDINAIMSMFQQGDYDPELLKSMGIDMSNMSGMFGDIANASKASGQEIAATAEETAAAVETTVDAVEDEVDEIDATLSNSTKGINEHLENGIYGSAARVSTAAKDVGDEAVDSLGTSLAKSVESGEFFGKGLVRGILRMIDKVRDASALLGDTALDALNGSLDEHSPSRLTYNSGEFFDLGFINSIKDGIPNAISAARNLGQSAYTALSKSIGNVSSVLTGNYTPRLAPVIDTKSYSSGLSYLTSSFNSAKGSIAKTVETIRGAKDSSTTIRHEFSDLTVRGVNDEDTFHAVADYSVEEILTKQLRRQYRV